MGTGQITWQVDERGNALLVAPTGRVDEATATEFAERLSELTETCQNTLILDLEGIAYMSSRGLRALTLAQRRAKEVGTTIVLARPNPTMREILAISRYDLIFKVTETIEAAQDG
jgi:anti-sigma B factor antagonist